MINIDHIVTYHPLAIGLKARQRLSSPMDIYTTPGAVLRKKVVLRVILRQRWSSSDGSSEERN